MIAYYEERAAAHGGRRDTETRLSILLSRVRLATFIPATGLLLFAMARTFSPAALIAALVLFAVFAGLVVWHARVENRIAWHEALHTENLFALARIRRAWDRLPPADEPPPSVEHHPYALDLDLFGRASLMQWLGPAATPCGGGTLQRWLLHPAPAAEVLSRQQAVLELAPALEWREQLGAHGRLAADVRPAELDTFLRWAEGPGPFTPATAGRLHIAVVMLTAAIWVLIALHVAGVIDGAFWLIPIVLGMILSFVTAVQVHGEFNRTLVGHHAFTRYAELFAHATAAPQAAPLLQRIQSRLAASGIPAEAAMRRLNRILGFAALRAGAAILHFPVQALTLWDFHVFFALDAWRRRVGAGVRGWMDAVGELDALSRFAHVQADNPDWCRPQVLDAAAREDRILAAVNLAHPLIPADRRRGNDVQVGPPGTVLLITGSNMSGKSTLLRAIGINAVLAQAGGPVCATSLRMPPVHLETSIRVQDSLEHGLSYFMAALARLKRVVDASHDDHAGRVVMYLLDEILQGTNTAERSIAVRGVARHLLQAGSIGAMTTHDLALAAEEPLKSAGRLVHFSELVDQHGGMTFDYRLRAGLATSRNALRLMHLIGIHLDGSPG